MTTFDDRERAFENRYAHEQDLAFRARARRDHKVALWAAERLKLAGPDGEAYAASVLKSAAEGAGDETVVGKLLADLRAGGVEVSEHQIRSRMDMELAAATTALQAE